MFDQHWDISKYPYMGYGKYSLLVQSFSQMFGRSVYPGSAALSYKDVFCGCYEMPICPFFVCAALLYAPSLETMAIPASHNEEQPRTNNPISEYARLDHTRSLNVVDNARHFLAPRQLVKRKPGKMGFAVSPTSGKARRYAAV